MSALFTIGLIMLTGSVLGSVAVYQRPEVVKDRLHTCFQRAKLYLKQKADDQWVYTYPTVQSHEQYKEHEEYTFTLPIGLDPERVYKYYWVFRQGFGEHIDLVGDTSTFVLKVYRGGIQQFAYNLHDIPLDGMRLPIVVGRSREGWEVYDMVEHPHLLVAGETGSGKSTHLRALLTTLIKHMAPDRLHLYLADLKRSEFHLFRDVPHVQDLLVDPKDVGRMLEHLRREITVRGDLLNAADASHIDDLENPPPYILLCVDEFALLRNEKKSLEILETISSVGRALGVFLCLSTQRADHKLMDGKLKANLTVRMAFRHADGVNSKITIGCEGAEDIKASEKGLMLIKMDGIKRVQSPYLSLENAKELLGK